MTETAAEKKRLRKQTLEKRDTLTKECRNEKNERITRILLASDLYKNAGQILAFASFGSEADLDPLIRAALADQKEVYLPKVEGDEMHFYRIEDLGDLVEGYRGIREPDSEKADIFPESEEKIVSSLLLLPGVVFDRAGGRIGYGKGFYDRFLQRIANLVSYENLKICAVAFDLQLMKDEILPMEDTDQKVPCIVTEEGLQYLL
ncbi:MAG: 5-formyltetrahydrofolate cyclo-ligase [Lachnospiraceae bacterium]|nr:5-formyltetrahydrofolate cyclo-ligase [Lachnospiraceae bacterium]